MHTPSVPAKTFLKSRPNIGVGADRVNRVSVVTPKGNRSYYLNFYYQNFGEKNYPTSLLRRCRYPSRIRHPSRPLVPLRDKYISQRFVSRPAPVASANTAVRPTAEPAVAAAASSSALDATRQVQGRGKREFVCIFSVQPLLFLFVLEPQDESITQCVVQVCLSFSNSLYVHVPSCCDAARLSTTLNMSSRMEMIS
ncbi:hypothetical protein EVAR_27039_1 [Eumeta japonica]|uniref:Uncharacterized protein n=1 Tax=Eumeta variegata TaxID=151549 RepID=A0A4C1WGS9_EUMVA|nr:hypothetical protein EVAR_27039_1 [Eumeta japonica]